MIYSGLNIYLYLSISVFIYIYIYIYIYTIQYKPSLINPRISWKIKKIYKSYNPNSKRCNLCLTDKLEILDDSDKNLLNKRSEIISQCRQRNSYKLKTVESSMTSGGIT